MNGRHIFPHRRHDHEKAYSPALKKTGGYSFMPASVAEPERAAGKARDYYPDFLMPFQMPAEGEKVPENTLETQTEPNQQREPDRKNGAIKVFDEGVIKILIPGTNRWVDQNGREVKPPRRF